MRTLVLALVLAAASCSTDPAPADVPVASDAADVVATDTVLPADVLDAGGAQACTAGRIEECPCGDGRRGMQTCQPSGVYGPCVCADAGSPMDVVVAADVVDAGAPRDVVDVGPIAMCGDASVNVLEGVRQPSGVFTHCGACGRSCAVAERCSQGACGPTCPNGITAVCDGRSIDLQGGERDGGLTHHCGRCGTTCPAGHGCLNCICIPL